MAAALENGQFDLNRFIKCGLETLNPAVELEQEPNMPAGHMASMFDARGPNFNCLTACAASSQAVGEATEIIRRGDADVMLSGGTHSMIHPLGVTGFSLLTALSTRNDEPTRASRPFDRLRDGFVIGEGAAMVVLEDLERAQRRGAPHLSARSSATERRPMPIASPISTRRDAVPLPACGWPLKMPDCRPTRSTTSTRTGPARRSTIASKPLACKEVFGDARRQTCPSPAPRA